YRLQLWLAQAENEPEALARAAGWVRERQITLKNELHHDLDYLEQTALHRLLIVQRRLQGRPDLQPLLDCLDQQTHFVRAKDWNERVITLSILRALALHAQGNMNQAVVSLQPALTLAEPAGYVRIFVDEGEPMAALLRRAAAEGIAVNYVNRLLADFGLRISDFGLEAEQPAIRSPVYSRAQSAIRTLVEPLSPREIEVLQLVATGATNPQIAQRLFVTVDTVKKHLSNIFGKLAVRNRTQATMRGRELGLLE
ncbi:MAG TPA: LuxR C-terminal-related transcriptional regulator, partial [Anaerolineae bacterium]|nr:LuxR C-terminal-related transcriptional regulator [Anaerolineae bacterium]